MPMRLSSRSILYPVFSEISTIFYSHQGRPHWGWVYAKTELESAALYPSDDFFKKLPKRLYPERRFINQHLESISPVTG
jgi:hypothetical protein